MTFAIPIFEHSPSNSSEIVVRANGLAIERVVDVFRDAETEFLKRQGHVWHLVRSSQDTEKDASAASVVRTSCGSSARRGALAGTSRRGSGCPRWRISLASRRAPAPQTCLRFLAGLHLHQLSD